MKQQWQRWSVAAALAAAMAGGMPLAHAQSGSLPPEDHQGAVSYVSGGIDSDQSGAFKREMGRWPLTIEMAAKGSAGNEYVADIPVQIMNGTTTVLDTRSKGPFLLVKLPPGEYTVKATYNGQEMSHKVSVPKSGHASTSFLWPHAS